MPSSPAILVRCTPSKTRSSSSRITGYMIPFALMSAFSAVYSPGLSAGSISA